MALLDTLRPFLGIALVVGVAWALSERRRRFSVRVVAGGIAVQLALALLLLRLPPVQTFFLALTDGVIALQEATQAGTSLMFGYLGGGPLPFEEPYPGAAFILATQALPLVLLVSTLSALLYHWHVLPAVIRGFSWALRRALALRGPASFGTAANIFVGNVEAPLLIRPYLGTISRSDLFLVMTAGMATVAGTVLALYAAILGGVMPDSLGHLLTASLISAPAAVMIAKTMIPDSGDEADEEVSTASPYLNAFDAITQGSINGLRLIGYIIGLVIALVALIALANIVLGTLPGVGGEPLTLQRLLGWVLAPVMWLIGIPWGEAGVAGQLFGTKVVLNELVSYVEMAGLPEGTIDGRTRLVLAYAMCGFANFGGVSVMIGGMSALAPERGNEIATLGAKALLAGNLATLSTGAVVAILV